MTRMAVCWAVPTLVAVMPSLVRADQSVEPLDMDLKAPLGIPVNRGELPFCHIEHISLDLRVCLALSPSTGGDLSL
jgi:hypothetical protein